MRLEMLGLRRRIDSIVVRELDSELVLLDTESDRVHHFNSTASFIWNHCEDAQSPENMAHSLAQAFDVDAKVALRDTVAILGTLRNLKLIVEA